VLTRTFLSSRRIMEEWRRLVEGGICELEDIDTFEGLTYF
jgi:hypothetical protein